MQEDIERQLLNQTHTYDVGALYDSARLWQAVVPFN